MICCDNLVHPFQSDTGTSQRQRIAEDLLSGSALIDGRKMADLLQFISQLSRHINFYDYNLAISDWQPFFSKSLPFILAGIIKYDKGPAEKKFKHYRKLFLKRPSRQSLQLLTHFVYYQAINPINRWHKQMKGSDLPAEKIMEKIIRDKLKEPVQQFICFCNDAVERFKIKKIDFKNLQQNSTWEFSNTDIIKKGCFGSTEPSRRKRLIALGKEISDLFAGLLNSMSVVVAGSELSLEQSILPLKDEFKQTHSPHLAILFAFLKLFSKFQNDLNGFTRKHLDFFYKDVLKLVPSSAVSDKAHILFEIQNHLEKYLVKKSIKVKGGKDNNKKEIQFATEDEIVVNKAAIADVKTLFLNNHSVKNTSFLEGVYIAPNARMADGMENPFTDGVPNNWPTLGNKFSKYIDPLKKSVVPYPYARLGFILASPVLLLNEGTRTVNIQLACRIDDAICDTSPVEGVVKDTCCQPEKPKTPEQKEKEENCRPEPEKKIQPADIITDVKKVLQQSWRFITQTVIDEALKKGISQDVADKVRNKFLTNQCFTEVCCSIQNKYLSEKIVRSKQWYKFLYQQVTNATDKAILNELFPARRAFKIYFSGEKEWIEPNSIENMDLSILPGNEFLLQLKVKLVAGQPAVSFYDKEKLKEDFNTSQPLVKIELDNDLGIILNKRLRKRLDINKRDDDCCIEKESKNCADRISLYHFFRYARLLDKTVNAPVEETKIDVAVCGLTKFVVQNDESLMSSTGPVYPFGTRPDIIDFDLVKSTNSYCINQAFIIDITGSVAQTIINHLQNLIAPTGRYKIGTTKKELDDFVAALPGITPGEIAFLTAQLENPSKNYCGKNLIGPNFYIGSKEVFCKNWSDVFININWKDKPVDFNEYYIGYWADPALPPPNPPPGFKQKYGLDIADFQINLSVLQDQNWKLEKAHPLPTPPAPPPPRPAETTLLNTRTNFFNRRLFPDSNSPSFCTGSGLFEQSIWLNNSFFTGLVPKFSINKDPFEKYDGSVQNGFVKINLQNQDFMHKDYAFVLARQMMALGKYPGSLIEGAVYRDLGSGTVIVFNNLANIISGIKSKITAANTAANTAKNTSSGLYTQFNTDADYQPNPAAAPVPPVAPVLPPPLNDPIQDNERDNLYQLIYNTFSATTNSKDAAASVENEYKNLENIYSFINTITGQSKANPVNIPIPNEPWTPVIRNISIDYKASAVITDVELIHLYPFANTSKHEEITLQPSLFPTFCDEGNMFIGFDKLVPGSNLNILFQLAEATADSESLREQLSWFYLDNNEWRSLREGFEVLNDATDQLTTSGIVKLALPANMTKQNTVLTKDLHWIRVSVRGNSRSIAETINIHTQAILAEFTNEEGNDQLRLDEALAAGSISKLTDADPQVKTVTQPYDSFGGREPEEEKQYYYRVSELLRHKGRAIQKWDYERLVLEYFPTIYKAKCINHSYALDAKKYIIDFPVAPGYVVVAVIPDLTKLKAGNSFEPKAPVSLLEQVEESLRKRTSPFVRLRVMNPRYEKIDICLQVKLYKGRDEVYYKQKLQDDIRAFLAPWSVGEFSKLGFGQCVNRSDMLRFLEGLDYLDYIVDLKMRHESKNVFHDFIQEICPLTPRSILIAGIIDVCIRQDECDEWGTCDEIRYGFQVAEKCCDEKPEPVHDFCERFVPR